MQQIHAGLIVVGKRIRLVSIIVAVGRSGAWFIIAVALGVRIRAIVGIIAVAIRGSGI